MAEVNKVAAIIIQDKKLLIAKDKGEEVFFIIGGKMEPGETEIETLHREVREELNCEITKHEPFAEFDTLNHDKTKTLHASCYLAELQGTPTAGEEIQEITWIDRNYKQKGIKLGNLLEENIVPELIKKGLL